MRRVWMTVATLGLLAAGADDADAIPAFARKYHASCSLCHSPVPRLNAFGDQFAANGFQFAVGEAPRDTIDTGDELLVLNSSLPLAIRMEGFMQAFTNQPADATRFDLQTPYGIKLLTGGQLAENVSWYMYFFMAERGEVAGLEDAYIQFTDVLGSGVNLIAGQFQVSDPLFKRELRLEFEDYQLYRVRVGAARPDMTYDRGLMALASPWEGGDVVLQLLNGRGLDPANEAKQYDTDDWKTYALRISQEIGPVRVGGFGYWGRERQDESTDSDIWVYGPDLTLSLGDVELNGTYLRRHDTNPFYAIDDEGQATDVDGVMAELVWGPQGPTGRWFLTALYNNVSSDEAVFKVRQGEPDLLSKYDAAALGGTYLLRRNLRLTGEFQWDLERDGARFTTGFVTAF
jgi:hypothetical protein